MQSVIDKAVLMSRHLLTVFVLGLAIGLALYAARFAMKVAKFAATVWSAGDTQVLLELLHLLDAVLIASLVVMVAISTHFSLVSPGADPGQGAGIGWIGKLDLGNLKIKLAGAIVAVSSIQLLALFLQPEAMTDRTAFWAVAIHLTFLAGAVLLAVMDRLGEARRG
jgi:uncharacterized protein (TIGR00645 family)